MCDNEIHTVLLLLQLISGVGRIFKSVCLSVCHHHYHHHLFAHKTFTVCPQHNSTANDPKEGIQSWYRDILEAILFWGSKVKGQGHRVNNATQ